VFKPDYPIRTARLVLRPYRTDDVDDFHACRSIPEVYRYLYGDPLDRATSRLGG
jgi:RimJ/RimL family protein N-acetyltransferase